MTEYPPPRRDLKIAVTSQNRKTITGHAGKCRKFWIYDVAAGEVQGRALLELSIDQTFHASTASPLAGIDALISGGMGTGLQARLRQQGVTALVTPETDPDRAVIAFLAGTLALGTPESHDHAGHDHHSWHGHAELENAGVHVHPVRILPPETSN